MKKSEDAGWCCERSDRFHERDEAKSYGAEYQRLDVSSLEELIFRQ